MSRIVASVVALLCALAVLTAAPAQADGPLRVLITGDSITHGRHMDYNWRYRLYKEFQRQGRAVDFVGSNSTPYVDPGYSTSRYADPNFDQDHFALAGAALSYMVPLIGHEVAVQQPDVVVMENGAADLLRGAQPADVDASLRAWIANVRDAKPQTRIILCAVNDLAKPGQPADTNARIAAYDVLERATAAELSTDASPITVADTNRGWNPSDHALSWDGLHPTPTGDTLYADRVAEAFTAVGLLGPADLYHSVLWPRTAPVSVAFAGNRATLTWDHQAVMGAVVRWHRIGSPWVQTGNVPAGRRVLPVVPGASYEFRVQLSRMYMSGPWGPVTRVRATSSRPAAPARVTVTRTGVRWSRSVGAASYVVKFRKVRRHRWITRHIHGLYVRASHVAVARVQAVGVGGRSGWRRAAA